MLISLPRLPARNRAIISASSGCSRSWIKDTRAMESLSSRLGDRYSILKPVALMIGVQRANSSAMNCRVARVEDWLEAGGDQDALNVRIAHHLPRRLGDLLDDRLGDADGGEQPVEIAGNHARQSGLDRGRNVGRRLDARRSVDREYAHLPRAME